MSKKVLIITYYWPPAGGPGVQRWLKFVKYLPSFGIEPIVYVPKNPNYPLVDTALEKEVPQNITVIKQPIFEPYAVASLFSKKQTKAMASGLINTKKQSFIEKMLLYVRGNFFIPDARKYWQKPSVKYLKNYIEKHQIDNVITTGPPHSLHLIGLQLKQELSIKWYADFRDPWTTIGYHSKMKLTKVSQKKHKLLEQQVLRTADHIISTSTTTKQEFSIITNQPITVITNGFDDVSFSSSITLDSKFSLAHIGSLLTGRNPEVLWKALAELLEELPSFKKDFELKLIGAVSDDVLATIKLYGLEKHVALKGYIPHLEAQQEQRKSQVLLLIEIDSAATKCIIPGKLFEYMQSNRPILAFGPDQADFKAIVQETNTGSSFGYKMSEIALVKQKIAAYYEAYQNKNLIAKGIGIQKYHRKNLTKALTELL